MTTIEETKTTDMVTIEANVERETEKAILIEATIDTGVGQRGKNIWVPKSLSHIVNESRVEIKDWFLTKKYNELKDEVSCFYGFIEF